MNHGDNAQPVLHSKKTWTGMHDRLRLLREAGIEIPPDPSGAGNTTNADDIIDAAAIAWTARRFHRHETAAYPPRGATVNWRVTDGNTATIWA
jgi:hypothetical protein